MDISSLDLRKSDLRKNKLEGLDFSDKGLIGANLSGVSLKCFNFNGAIAYLLPSC
jgi:uncharacterized protein YjbI with pentapeptide repeats